MRWYQKSKFEYGEKMIENEPLVSVFLPTYNQEEFIGEAIQSVLNQDYENLEIVVGDDCSQDRTWEIVQKFQHKFPRKLKSFRNKNNLGITGNCNEVLKCCTGEYIAFHAGDDVWLQGKLSNQIGLMKLDSSCLMSYHDLDVFDSETNNTLRYWNTGKKRPSPVEGESDDVLNKLIEHSAGFLGALSVVIRRSALDIHARYDVRLPHLSELTMWVNVLYENKGNVKFIPKVLARYRKHQGCISHKNHDVEGDFFLAIIENEYPKLISAVRQARGRKYYTRGVRSVLSGNYEAAFKYLLISIRYSVYSPKVVYWLGRALVRS